MVHALLLFFVHGMALFSDAAIIAQRRLICAAAVSSVSSYYAARGRGFV